MPTLSGGYTASEIMQMQRRANRQLRSPEASPLPPKKAEPPSLPKPAAPQNFLASILQDDSLLILLLILLLYKNDGDRKLILALLSLLL